MKSSCNPVIQSGHEASNLDLILFTIFINGLDDEAPQKNLRGMLDMPEGHAANQRELNRVDNWEDRNIMGFNKEKCEALHLGRNYPTHLCIWGPPSWKADQQKRTWVS